MDKIVMDDDLLTLLQSSKIFSSLTKRVCKKLLTQFEKIELHHGEVLYHQGDPSDSIELIQNGALVSILTIASGETKVVGEIGPGETVGELGALSGEPRSTTIKAAKTTILFKLPSEKFVELCHQYPAFLFSIINPIVSRSQKLVELVSSEKFKKHIVIIPANDDVSLTTFSERLSEQVSDLMSIVCLSDYNTDSSLLTRNKILNTLEAAKEKNVKRIKQKIIYLLKSTESELAKFCFEKAEMIYVVGHENAPIMISSYVSEKIHKFTLETKLKPELILLHQDNTELPRDTASWLKLTDFALHHHVRLNNTQDYSRLVRFIRNKPVALVLSGGGTRGWAHAGAIRALHEAGIPIDIIGGTSVGAIVAASYALTLSSTETLAQFREVIEASRDSVSWRSLTWPAISLFNSKGLTSVLEKLFGRTTIEDLWLPYYCISTNFAKSAETVHRFGSLWEQVRCSVAIPGVIPPMLLDGELHFDGGLLNNLPVDVMRKMIGHRGTIVAVELVANVNDTRKYDFPPILTFWRTLFGKLGLAYDYKFPRFIDTFLKSLLIGSSVRAQQNSLAANILISIDLSRFPMLHSNKKLESRIIDMGYDTAMENIKNMKRSKTETHSS